MKAIAFTVWLFLVFLIIVGIFGTKPSPVPTPTPTLINTGTWPQVTITNGLYVKWDLFIDTPSHRWVLLAGAGCPDATNCQGVPGGGSQFDLILPQLPFTQFCIDTLKLGTKQPLEARASMLILSAAPGHGQPSVSVRSDDGAVHIDRLCYPHEGQNLPHIWLANSWCEIYTDCQPGARPIPQVMTFVIAGDYLR